MEQQNKEIYWSQFAEEFEEKQAYVTGEEILKEAMEELLTENNLGSALELGCGTGLYTESIQKKADSIMATDFSDEMIELANNKRGNLEHVKFEKADALNLNYENESYDTVFMANLIHIIGNANRVISESSRVLKKGGLLIITSFAIDEMSFFSRFSMGIRYIKTFGKPSKEATKEKTTRKSIETLLKKNGFEISKSKVLGGKSKAYYITAIKQ